MLDSALSPENRLVVISAPAGYGKTSLVSDWIQQVSPDFRFGWLSLDAGDNDPHQFMEYLAASLADAAPRAAASLSLLLDAPQPVPLELLISSLLQSLAEVKEPQVLVLDDYHVIKTTAIHEALIRLIDYAPPNFHLVVTTRADPPFPLHRYRARGQMLEIRMADLRFSLPELTDLLTRAQAGTLSPEEINVLEDRTEGWAAGIQMAVLSLRGKADPSQFVHNLAGSRRFILEYLTEEVFKEQPETIQQFLLETSILDRMSPALCDAVIAAAGTDGGQEGSSQDILAYLEKANLFLVPLDAEGTWFRYHHLFADLLQMRLKHSSDPERQRVLHKRASAWFDSQGWTAEAIQHAIAAQDFERAASLVEQNTISLLAAGELHRVLSWVGMLPAGLAASRPWLNICQAWVLAFAGKASLVEPYLLQAEANIESANYDPAERDSLRAEITAIRALLTITGGAVEAPLELARSAADVLPTGSSFARGVYRWAVGFARRMAGDLPGAEKAFEDVLKIGRETANVWTVSTACVDLGMVVRLSGRLRKAESIYRQGLAWMGEAGARGLGFVGRLESFLANVLYEKNSLDEALGYALASIEHNRLWQNPNHVAHGYWVLARIRSARKEYPEAESALASAEEIAAHQPVVPPLRALIASARLASRMAQGDLQAASNWLHEHPLPAGGYTHSLDEYSETMALAGVRALMALNDRREAMLQVLSLEAAARKTGRIHTLIEALVLKALLTTQSAALEALEEALAPGLPEGFARVYLNEGQALMELLAAVAASGRLNPSNLQAARQLLAASPGLPTGSEASVLTGRELEILACIAEGLANAEIGRRLFISTGTVKAHTAAIYRKLDVLNRTAAIAKAKDTGLL